MIARMSTPVKTTKMMSRMDRARRHSCCSERHETSYRHPVRRTRLSTIGQACLATFMELSSTPLLLIVLTA